MNFKGYVGLPLEMTAKRILNKNAICGVSVSADDAETGGFISIMVFLLYIEKGNTDDVLLFLKKSSQYLGLKSSDIEIGVAHALYCEFEALLEV